MNSRSVFKHLRSSTDFQDVTLVCGTGREIKAHKVRSVCNTYTLSMDLTCLVSEGDSVSLLSLLPEHVLQHSRQTPRCLPQRRPLRRDEGLVGVHVPRRGVCGPGEPLLPAQGGGRPEDQGSC